MISGNQQGVDMLLKVSLFSLFILLTASVIGIAEPVPNTNAGPVVSYTPPLIIRDLYVRYYFLGGSLESLGVDYFFDRSFWAGFNVGLTFVPGIAPGRTLVVVTDTLEAGYFFIGNMDQDFRLGVVASFSAYFCTTGDVWHEISDKPSMGFYPGVWLSVEVFNITLRAGVVYDFNADQPMRFMPSFGLVF